MAADSNALAPRSARSYTPRHLAEAILRSRSALEGERKQLTVFFADVKGSMELAAGIDAEAWHRIMDRFFEILADGIHRFEGTINQFTGDGVMALFGAPIAHEDHAQRACHAALYLREELRGFSQALRREHGLDFAVRMSLNSGEVVVGRIGDDLRMDYTAKGQTVGLAARIEQIAEGGKVYVSEETARRVAGYFSLEDLGAFQLKGIAEPVRVHELVTPGPMRSRLELARARGFSRFVGRSDEMATLDAALEQALAGHGRVACVVAEAGTGKSRLCHEFAERCRGRRIPVIRAHAVSHGAMIPFLPILELLREAFGIGSRDGDAVVRQKVAGAMVLLDRELEADLPVMFEFLGVADPERRPSALGPEEQRRRLFEIVTRSLVPGSRREPRVILIDDLQWVDESSEALLRQLVEAVAGSPTLIVVNFRPEYHDDWLRRSVVQRIPLLPLRSEALRELTRDLLGDDESVQSLADRIRERTGGNPFFTEEVVRSLAEAGCLEGSAGHYRLSGRIDAIEIPDSVKAVLAERIDRLTERAKEVLQTAAVIGKRFPGAILGAVFAASDSERRRALDALVAAELVFEESLYPVPVYAFKHPLTQEVAYASLLQATRARIHAAVARAYEELDFDRLDERAALLAHHCERAERPDEAARWHAHAADIAGFVDAAGSLFHWQQLRRLLDASGAGGGLDELRLRACIGALEVGGRAGLTTDDASTLFDEGRELAVRFGDSAAEVRLRTALAARLGWSGELELQRQHLGEATRLADRAGDPELSLVVLQRAFVAEFHGGDMRAALTLARRGVERAEGASSLASDTRDPYLYRRFLLSEANALAQMGDLARSDALLARVDDLSHGEEVAPDWERTAHTRALVRATLALYRGDEAASLRSAFDFASLAERSRSTWAQPMSNLALGRAHLLAERFPDACDALERSIALARAEQIGLESEAAQLACLAEARAGCGDAESALRHAEEAIAIARRRGTRFWELEAQLAHAGVLLSAGPADAETGIETALARAEQLITETGGEVMRPALALLRADLAAARGDREECERHRGEARRLYLTMGATAHAERIAARHSRPPR